MILFWVNLTPQNYLQNPMIAGKIDRTEMTRMACQIAAGSLYATLEGS